MQDTILFQMSTFLEHIEEITPEQERKAQNVCENVRVFTDIMKSIDTGLMATSLVRSNILSILFMEEVQWAKYVEEGLVDEVGLAGALYHGVNPTQWINRIENNVEESIILKYVVTKGRYSV